MGSRDLPTRASDGHSREVDPGGAVESKRDGGRGGIDLPHGLASSIGSLPHTDPRAASTFVLERQPRLPAAPSLPARSGMERMVAQAAWGIDGVRVLPDGSLQLDDPRLDPRAPLTTVGIDGEPFVGLRAFLGAVAGRRGPIKLQLTGPVTLGIALLNLGVPADTAFAVAGAAVRSRARTLVASRPGDGADGTARGLHRRAGPDRRDARWVPARPQPHDRPRVERPRHHRAPRHHRTPLLRRGRLARRAPGRRPDPLAPARCRCGRPRRGRRRLPRARRLGGVGRGPHVGTRSAPPPSASGTSSRPSGAASPRAAATRWCSASRP